MGIFVHRAAGRVDEEAQGAAIKDVAERPSLKVWFENRRAGVVARPGAIDPDVVPAFPDEYGGGSCVYDRDNGAAFPHPACRTERVRRDDDRLMVIRCYRGAAWQ